MNNKHAIHKQLTTHYSLLTNFAFTLAETLIVMGIIGVVAALTLPNLNSSTGDKEKIAKVKKFYSNFSDAFGRAEVVYGPVDEWFKNDANNAAKTKRFAERLADFMKISKNCQTGTGCFATGKQKKLRGGESSADFNNSTLYYKYVLADGTSIGFNVVDISGESEFYDINLILDIDGPNAGGNTLGKDVYFIWEIGKDGSLRSGSDDFSVFSDIKQNCFIDGSECTGWIMQTGNMDYVKADKDGKCPNGTQLSETVTSCK